MMTGDPELSKIFEIGWRTARLCEWKPIWIAPIMSNCNISVMQEYRH